MSNVKFSQLPNLGNITANTIVPVVSAGTNYTVTTANLQSYVNSSTGNVTAGNIRTGGLISATGNVTSGNVSIVGGTLAFANSSIVQSNPLDLSITGVYQISVKPAGGSYQWTFGNDGALTGPTGLGVTGYVSATGNVQAGNIRTAGLVSATANVTGGNILTAGVVTATGNITTAGNFVGNGAALTNVATRFEGSWTAPVGNSTQSFTVTPSETYYMWVDCNIPNGILAWNATATITNTNVPVVGAQYAWVYNGGGTPIDFTSIPNQFVGTANSIVRSSTAPSATTNRFDFGINNTSGNSQTVRYGWVTIS